MSQPVVVADAFTDRAFGGNPAAVCLLQTARAERWMAQIAREMNHSETAFLVRREAGDGYDLRWFTPTVEVDLCGHATLASAHVLLEDGEEDGGSPIRFHTRSGVLGARQREGDDGLVEIELDFPAVPVVAGPAPAGLLEALGVRALACGRAGPDLLVEVASEDDVLAVRPDLSRLRAIDCRGVIVTAAAGVGRDADFVSRFFAPASGVDEDPVTGSAHCALGPFWAARLGRAELVGEQLSERGGTVGVRVEGRRAALRGRAVTTMRGELLVD